MATKCSRVCDDVDDKRFDALPPLLAPLSVAPLGGNFLAAKASRRDDAVDALLPARLVVANGLLRSPFDEDVAEEEPLERRDDWESVMLFRFVVVRFVVVFVIVVVVVVETFIQILLLLLVVRFEGD